MIRGIKLLVLGCFVVRTQQGIRTLGRVDRAFARYEGKAMPFTRYADVFGPVDLEVMQRVFDQLCEERRLAQKNKDEREELALQIIRLFQQGTMNEDDLRRSLSRSQMGQGSARGQRRKPMT